MKTDSTQLSVSWGYIFPSSVDGMFCDKVTLHSDSDDFSLSQIESKKDTAMFFEGRLIGLRLLAISYYALQIDVVGVVTNSLVIHFPDVFKVWNKILK